MRITYIIIILFFSTKILGQHKNFALEKKILKADSVLLISHESTSLIPRNQMNPSRYRLILKKTVNQNIIIERKIIKDSLLRILAQIICAPFLDSTIEKGRCFNPRNTIFIYKKSKISFINLCFECREFETSKDIKISKNDFDNSIWEKIETFFKAQGFRYGF